MKLNLAWTAVTTAEWAAICLVIGCLGGPGIDEPTFDTQAVADTAMRLYDANKDGQISDEEISEWPGLVKAMGEFDTDGDGVLSAEETVAVIEFYADIRMSVAPLVCHVSMDDHPLSGATVNLIPTEFMEGMVKPAEGVTDESGQASPTMDDPVAEGEGDSGVNPGFYHVKISLVDSEGNETIPAKYNTETTLGCHVGRIFLGMRARYELTSQ